MKFKKIYCFLNKFKGVGEKRYFGGFILKTEKRFTVSVFNDIIKE
ncbi:hypothetical protein B6S40_14470 [Enterococcus faecalis]|nr:hypothetical protein B6S40_14470 [Enterococcus faecalis]